MPKASRWAGQITDVMRRSVKFWAVLLPLSAVNLQDDAAFDPPDWTHARTYRADPTPKAGVAGSIKLLIDLDRLSPDFSKG